MPENAKDFLKKCIEFYSPSGSEEKYAQFLFEFLKNHEFNVKFDKVGNLIAEKGKGKPELLFVSHMDTIPGKLPIIEKEGKIFGRGAVDCKPSLASMVYSIAKYDLEKLKTGKIIFGGIVREEDSLIGIQEFLKSNIKPDYSIFGEPTTINQICIGYKGRLCLSHRIFTKAGHVASSWQYINAIEIALEIWNIIKGVCWQLTEEKCLSNEPKEYYNKVIPNLSVITGGKLTNVVPSDCMIQVDIRFPPQIKSQVLLSKIRKSIEDFKIVYESNVNGEFQIQESISSLIEGFEIKNDELIIGALRWAIYKTTNIKPKLIKKTGTTFINQIGLEYKIPSITYGPGDPKLEHTEDEFIEIDEYLQCIEIYSKFIDKIYENFQKKHGT